MATRSRTITAQPSVTKPEAERNVPETWSSLLHFNDVPKWLQDNHYIHTGYRRESNSYSRSFASVLHIHNETVNIWTHLLPAISSIPTAYVLHQILAPRYEKASRGDVVAMGCFFAGATACLGMSATYHSLSNHSAKVAKFWNQLDYAGIACLIAGSFIPSVYYGFWCAPGKQIVYWTMICSLGTGCTIMSLLPKFRTPDWRPVRAGMFVGMGLSAVIPVIDGIFTYGFRQMRRQIGLSWVVLQGVLYILGAGLYARRFPERKYPGKFDIVGSSHQIFHVLVVLAAVSHLVGLIKAFDYRHGPYGAVCG